MTNGYQPESEKQEQKCAPSYLGLATFFCSQGFIISSLIEMLSTNGLLGLLHATQEGEHSYFMHWLATQDKYSEQLQSFNDELKGFICANQLEDAYVQFVALLRQTPNSKLFGKRLRKRSAESGLNKLLSYLNDTIGELKNIATAWLAQLNNLKEQAKKQIETKQNSNSVSSSFLIKDDQDAQKIATLFELATVKPQDIKIIWNLGNMPGTTNAKIVDSEESKVYISFGYRDPGVGTELRNLTLSSCENNLNSLIGVTKVVIARFFELQKMHRKCLSQKTIVLGDKLGSVMLESNIFENLCLILKETKQPYTVKNFLLAYCAQMKTAESKTSDRSKYEVIIFGADSAKIKIQLDALHQILVKLLEAKEDVTPRAIIETYQQETQLVLYQQPRYHQLNFR